MAAEVLPSPLHGASFEQPLHPPPRRMPSTSLSAGSFDDQYDLSTLPDPRGRAMSPAAGDEPPSPEHHPDLDEEVATLSNKLINAINYQTNLDDTLSHTRMELEESRGKIRELEGQIEQQREMLAGDVWVRRKTVDAEKAVLLGRVAEEKKARHDVEQQKRRIEQELETLTAALFEEANKMVINTKEEARREHEGLQRRIDQLRSQQADTEELLRSQQVQLAELKGVMEQMSAERDDQTTTALTAPSSPGFSKCDSRDEDRLVSDGASQAGMEPISPSHPTSFAHLLQPVLRTDLSAYDDFVGLIRTSKRLSTTVNSRPPSGTHSSLAVLGLGLSSSVAAIGSPSSSSSPSPSPPHAGTPTSATGSSPQTPNTPAPVVHLPPLKETKLFKRVLAEDIEPTLRLDTAPGLSWRARRSVLNAMTEGSLVVEPVPTTQARPLSQIQSFLSRPQPQPQQYPCALCGDSRKDEAHLRRHRFRTSEVETAQRYPLCSYCLGRVRSTCDFLGFLRMIKDGHWRADDEDAEKAAWEESVRLREQMFWCRIGGGVLPAPGVAAAAAHGASSSAPSVKSPRVSQEEGKGASAQGGGDGSSRNPTQEDGENPGKEEAAPTVQYPRVVETHVENTTDSQLDNKPAEPAEPADPQAAEAAPSPDPSQQSPASLASPSSARNSAQALTPLPSDVNATEPKRLSLHIPGFP